MSWVVLSASGLEVWIEVGVGRLTGTRPRKSETSGVRGADPLPEVMR